MYIISSRNHGYTSIFILLNQWSWVFLMFFPYIKSSDIHMYKYMWIFLHMYTWWEWEMIRGRGCGRFVVWRLVWEGYGVVWRIQIGSLYAMLYVWCMYVVAVAFGWLNELNLRCCHQQRHWIELGWQKDNKMWINNPHTFTHSLTHPIRLYAGCLNY